MARARPSARIRFNAKIDTSVTAVSNRITAIDPRIANTPTANGSAAASSPPKTHTSTTKLTGRAIASITWRSFMVCSTIWT